MNRTTAIVVIALASVMALGCKEVISPPPPPPPPPASSASAEVDGEGWNTTLAGSSPLAMQYWLAVNPEGHPVERAWCVITFGRVPEQPGPGEVATAIGMRFWGEMTPGVIAFGDPANDTTGHGVAAWSVNGDGTHTEWMTDASHTGRLVIESVDATRHHVNGSFEFRAWNGALGTEVTVQRGRFEGTYANQPRTHSIKLAKSETEHSSIERSRDAD